MCSSRIFLKNKTKQKKKRKNNNTKKTTNSSNAKVFSLKYTVQRFLAEIFLSQLNNNLLHNKNGWHVTCLCYITIYLSLLRSYLTFHKLSPWDTTCLFDSVYIDSFLHKFLETNNARQISWLNSLLQFATSSMSM